MTCTHQAYFPQPTVFLEFPCLCGGVGGTALLSPFSCSEVPVCLGGGGGGGCTFIILNGGGGYYTFPHVEHFPRFHIFPFSTCCH